MKKIYTLALMTTLIGFTGMAIAKDDVEIKTIETPSQKVEFAIEDTADAIKANSKKAGKYVKEKSIEAGEKTKAGAKKGAEKAKKATIKAGNKVQNATAKGMKKAGKKIQESAEETIEKTDKVLQEDNKVQE